MPQKEFFDDVTMAAIRLILGGSIPRETEEDLAERKHKFNEWVVQNISEFLEFAERGEVHPKLEGLDLGGLDLGYPELTKKAWKTLLQMAEEGSLEPPPRLVRMKLFIGDRINHRARKRARSVQLKARAQN